MQKQLQLQAKEEGERNTASLSVAALVQRREKGRDAACAVVAALKELLDDLETAWRTQEEAREERRRARERERERLRLRRLHQEGEWDDESSLASSLNTLQRAEQRQAGERQSEPSIPMFLNGNYKPPRLPRQRFTSDDSDDGATHDDGDKATRKFEAKLRGLCGRVWGFTSHHSNPELSSRNLVDKVLLCLDKQVEAPPSPGVGSYGGDLNGLRSRAVAISPFASAPERAA